MVAAHDARREDWQKGKQLSHFACAENVLLNKTNFVEGVEEGGTCHTTSSVMQVPEVTSKLEIE